MKIAIFTDTYFPQINGVVTSTVTLKHQLEALGHTVLVICPKIGEEVDSTEDVWRFRSVPFPFQKEHRITSPLSRKLKQIKELKIDVVHIQTPFFMGHLGQYLSWYHKIPMVHTYHTFWAEYLHYFPVLPAKLRKPADMLVLSKKFCDRCQHVIVPSNQMKDILVEYGTKTPLSVIPTGVEIGNATVSAEDILSFKHAYDLKSDDKVCIFVGRLGMEKNVMFMLESFHMVHQRFNKAKLLIVGDGPERQAMVDYTIEHNLSEVVIFTGYLSHQEVFTAYAASDVITFPSTTETQGLSLLEGLSLGNPAVCINAMGVKDILENENGGFLVNEDLDAYSQKLILLLKNESVYNQKKKEALAIAQKFSAVEMAKKTIAVYSAAIEEKNKQKTKKRRPFETFFKGPFWKLFIKK